MGIGALLNYLKRIGSWLWRGKFHILTFGAVFVTILYLVGVVDFYPSEVSLVMSITGLSIIFALQMLDAREYADHKPNTVRNWISDFPSRKPIQIIAEGIGSATAFGRATAIVSVAPNATIDQKVDFLLRSVTTIQENIGGLHGRIDDVESSQKSQVKDLKNSLDQLNASLKTVIAGHVVGDYDKNQFGIVITICGTLIQFFNP